MAQTIEQKWNKFLKQGNKQAKNTDFETFKSVCEKYDPTCKNDEIGVYADWIMKYFQQLVHIHRDTYVYGLADFHEYKKRLPSLGMSANIWDYKPSELPKIHRKINELRNSKVSIAENNAMDKLKGQFELFQVNSDWVIVNTHTYAAEQFFGSNTHWCTVGTKYYFDLYSDSGYYIAIPIVGGELDLKSKKRIQFHIGDNCQLYCCDVMDYKVHMEEVPNKLKQFVKDRIDDKKQLVKASVANMFVKLINEINDKLDLEPITSKRTSKIAFQLNDEFKLVLNDEDLSMKLYSNGHYITLGNAISNNGYKSHTNIEEFVNNSVLTKYIDSVRSIIAFFTPEKTGCGMPQKYEMNRGEITFYYTSQNGTEFHISKRSGDCLYYVYRGKNEHSTYRNTGLIINSNLEEWMYKDSTLTLSDMVDMQTTEEQATDRICNTLIDTHAFDNRVVCFCRGQSLMHKQLGQFYSINIGFNASYNECFNSFVLKYIQNNDYYYYNASIVVRGFDLGMYSHNEKAYIEAALIFAKAAEKVAQKNFHKVIEENPQQWRAKVQRIMSNKMMEAIKEYGSNHQVIADRLIKGIQDDLVATQGWLTK